MRQIKNLVGQRVGALTVIKFNGRVARNGNGSRILWLCRCDCGTEISVRAERLYRSSSSYLSCGCASKRRKTALRNEFGKYIYNPCLRVVLNMRLAQYKKNARLRKRDFSLSIDAFKILVTSPCSYCGFQPSLSGDNIQVNGIDRINNDLGYAEGNVTSCCAICNTAKQKMPLPQFLEWIERAARHIIVHKQSILALTSQSI